MSTLNPVSEAQSLRIRHNIKALEAAMLQHDQVPIVTRHIFSDGLYAREIDIPKGTLLTGMIHLKEHINIISKGEILVLTEDGPKRIKAPATIVSRPGTKRLGYALEDTTWTTIHASQQKDIAAVEAELVTNEQIEEGDAEKLAALLEALPCPL